MANSNITATRSGHTVYICVGLPGSGKSTHSRTVELTSSFAADPFDQVVRINQDQLGSRGACYSRAVQAVKNDQSVIIDRCNVSRVQRKYWIDLAKRYGYRVVVELFHVDPEVCLNRCNARQDHETMTNQKAFRSIINGFRLTWQTVEFSEGVDEIWIRDASGKIIDVISPDNRKNPSPWQSFKRWLKRVVS